MNDAMRMLDTWDGDPAFAGLLEDAVAAFEQIIADNLAGRPSLARMAEQDARLIALCARAALITPAAAAALGDDLHEAVMKHAAMRALSRDARLTREQAEQVVAGWGVSLPGPPV